MLDDVETVGVEMGDEGSSTEIVSGTVCDAVADRQDLRAGLDVVGAHEVRRYRIIAMPSVSASEGSTRQPCSKGRHVPTDGGVGSTSNPGGVE